MIYVAGETILDLAQRGDGAYEPALGGSAFNTARALGRLGAPAGFLGALSRDPWGDRFVASLEAAGVDTSAARRCDAPSALALVSPETPRGPQFTLYLDGTTHDHAQPPETLPADAAHLHTASFHAMGGATGPLVLALMQRSAARASLSFDPNIRPAVLPPRDVTVAAAQARVALCTVVKASEEDMAWLYPDVAPEDAMRRWSGPRRLAVLTRGPRGAVGFLGDLRLEAQAPAVTVVDTVGAGDVFTAGLLAHMARDGALGPDGLAKADAAALSRWLAFAAKAAALTCARRGADAPTLAEMG